MKRLLFPLVLLAFSACDDSTTAPSTSSAKKADAGTHATAGVCELSKCAKPATGIACCTPNAECGTDPTGFGLGCVGPAPAGECTVSKCPAPATGLGKACCTPLATCGFDPFENGIFCFPNGPKMDASTPKPTCNLSKCSAPDGGPHACCQANGECGADTLGIGLCFPPPPPVCDPAKCPAGDAGINGCCALNNECGLDLLGIGLCFPPPPAANATCDLAKCPGDGDVKACCLPNGKCGLDSLNIGVCFPPPPPKVDAGTVTPPPVQTTPPDDPSITGECPSFIGVFGPEWGCCSPYGVCGTFTGNQCAVAAGTQIPTPGPLEDAGAKVKRCTVPATKH